MIKLAMMIVLMAVSISGCSKSIESIIPTATNPAAANMATATPAGSFPTLPAQTPISSASPTPYTPFTVNPSVDNLKLRVNPGYLFDALMMIQQTDTLTVLGKAPGGEWTYVKTADDVEGWVFTLLLKSNVDLKQIPLREPQDVLLIKGKVADVNGIAIQGVGFNIAKSSQPEATDSAVVSDANGEFYFFLPSSESDTWDVRYTAIACESNVWSDTSCSAYKTGYTGNVDPQNQSVSLPQTSPLTFTWR